jgi:nucleoside-diphosphate-sugar epimerase
VRVLITVASGFVGQHLTAALAALPDALDIVAATYGDEVPGLS